MTSLSRNLRGILLLGIVLAIAYVTFGLSPAQAQAAVFTVNSTEDSTDGSCDHPFLSSSNDCTFREALEEANALPGTDAIDFAIDSSFSDDGNGQWDINIESNLPSIIEPIVISAASVWDTDNDRPGVHLSGEGSTTGLVLGVDASGTHIQGLEISDFKWGVYTQAGSITVGTDCDVAFDAQERNVIYNSQNYEIYLNNVSSNIIRGNYIGVQADGLSIETVGGSWGIGIIGEYADNNIVGFEEGTSATCPVELQRNVVGGVGGDAGIRLDSSNGVFLEGDASQGPDQNRISGNYIGVGSDGETDVTDGAGGIDLRSGSTLNIVGTDGDGVDDEFEGNVVGGWANHGIFFFKTGYNRASGNIVGLSADQATIVGNGVHGINARGTGNIVGWCDATVHATLCSNGGSAADQANISSGNSSDGIRAGALCNNCEIYGNLVGTNEAGENLGNQGVGIYVHPGLMGARIGGSMDDQGNTIQFNSSGGIVIDGLFCYGNNCSKDREPTTDFLVEGNMVTQNDIFGIRVLGTDISSSGTPGTGAIQNNIVQNNNGAGIQIEASSPNVSSNTVEANTSYGIEVSSGYNDPTYVAPASNESSTYNPPEISISAPTLSANTISTNQSGGLFVLNADPSNLETLYDDNTFSSNEDFAVRRDTFFSVRLTSVADPDLTDESLIIRLSPTGDTSCTGDCEGSTFDTSDSGDVLWGPENIIFEDPRTWFQVTDFSIDTSGTEETYGPYTVNVTGSVIAEFTQEIETAIDGDSSTTAPVSAHRPSSGMNGIFFSEPVIPVPSEGSVPMPDASTPESVSEAPSEVGGLMDTIETGETVVLPPEPPEAIGGGMPLAQLEAYIYFAQPFSLVKTANRDTVYMVDIDQSRRPFLNPHIFFTWYEDFRFVRVISEQEMASIPVGPAMLPRPGTVLVKQVHDPKLYAVEFNMTLRWIPVESQVEELYGLLWQKQVLDLEPALFHRYTIAREALNFGEVPNGTVVDDGAHRCQIYFGWCNEVTKNGFAANRLSERFVRRVSSETLEAMPYHRSIAKMEDSLLTERLPFF